MTIIEEESPIEYDESVIASQRIFPYQFKIPN